MEIKLLCACDGRACKGSCRETNLYRKRSWEQILKGNKREITPIETNKCPAAYNPPIMKGRNNESNSNRQYTVSRA